MGGDAARDVPLDLVDRPEAYLPGDRRRALAAGATLPDRVRGSALFADISGFTPLTEALVDELGPRRGPEELTARIDRVLHVLIDEVHRAGGEVIYLSGDAITCWLDGDDGLRAAACGLAMQRVTPDVGATVTPAGRTVELAIKVAVAVGAARRFVVGDPSLQLIDVLAGRPIDELAEAEPTADQGDVVLAPSAVEALDGRIDRDGHRLRVLRVGAPEPMVPAREDPVAEDVVRPWILPAVYERLVTGGGAFLGELRPAHPVFVRFGGIDVGEDDDAIEQLDAFVTAVQRVFDRYGGNVLQLTLGDKGAYLYGLFGSPVAHDDDAARACAAALDVLRLDGVGAARDIQVGVTDGRVFSGTYGHPMRRTFVGLGDPVNLAARLMSTAPPGAAYVSDDVRRRAGDRFDVATVGELTVKGRVRPVLVHSLIGRRAVDSGRQLRFPLPMVGRAGELQALRDAHTRSRQGAREVVVIVAEAGRGKSRLVAEAVREFREAGSTVAFGEAAVASGATSYGIWQEVWHQLLGLRPDDPAPRRGERLARVVRSVDERLAPRAPLLGPVLGLDLPDTPLTATFDAKLRKTSLESLLASLFARIATGSRPVVVLEDCQAMDQLSRDLLIELVRASSSSSPVLFVLATRPVPDGDPTHGLSEVCAPLVLELGELATDDVEALVATKARQLFGDEVVPSPDLVRLVGARAGQPVLRGGTGWLPEGPAARPRRSRLVRRPAGARQPPPPRARPDRSARGGATHLAEGRQRGRALVRQPDGAIAHTRARRAGRRRGSSRLGGARPARAPRPTRRPRLVVPARRHPRGGLREPAVRPPRRSAPTRARPARGGRR